MAFDNRPDPASSAVRRPRFVSQLTRNSFAMILEGAHSQDLHELTDWRSKPAVSFGGKFRLIDFALSNCVNSGVRRVGVATQYRAQSLIRHLQLGWSFLDGRLGEFIEIMPAQQQLNASQWYRGTADAVFQNWREVARAAPDYVLILAGDHIYRMDYGRLLAEHVQRCADATLACISLPAAQANPTGVMTLDALQRVLQFHTGPALPGDQSGDQSAALTSMGIYVFNTDFLYRQLQQDAADAASGHDFLRDVIPRCLAQGSVYAHRFEDSHVGEPGKPPYWRDVGTLDAYWEANMDLVQVDPHLNVYDKQWPIWTWQPQSPPAKFVFNDEQRCGVALDAMVAGGCIISGATVRRSMVFPNVRMHSYSLVQDCVVLSGVQIGRHCALQKCIIDKNCTIPDGTQIGLDPLEDAKRYHVTPLGVTLVTRVMLGQEKSLLD
ncbi:glucose-1-phosphate adenylyltransferase [Rhodoferax antarcticus]|uniref:Glucose-1-phosphate adenylyltransferase n=1 Tax=Rhodoferax antarcticus ANT.BR TaxID=1111071 RepID=A0A1Q8YI54_9BURK|nr:glucose-1-phosphate adenylyltransferase [Rhodoferax antarcticus]APW45295.1 glucose-1-phosphate adenylyltransferase [Rhodoferax antarcticus]OLP07590.1 glucose-1-phosphate adenylyltransferase [Rhodoferax antarcticus ANT.BR]